jgi:hypothetical protein
MTQAVTDKIMELCRLICQEHDPVIFQKLVTELNQLLTQREINLKKTADLASSDGQPSPV